MSSWQLKTEAQAQAGNRASKTRCYLQWWDSRVECQTVTSGGCKLHNQDLIYSPRFNPGLKLLQQVIMKAVPATVMAGSLPKKSIIEHTQISLFPAGSFFCDSGDWSWKCSGVHHVLSSMWILCPNQVSSLQGSHGVNRVFLAVENRGTGSGWQQSKQNSVLLAVVG